MEEMSDILSELKKAVLEGEDDDACRLAQKAVNDKNQSATEVYQAIMLGIQEAGHLWKQNIYFQPDVVMSTEAFRAAMEVVEPHLGVKDIGLAGKVVIGTVAGDVHDLGKMIVNAMLRASSFSVIDLGVDVPAHTFISKVEELKPDILGIGCYMTTTMLQAKEVIKGLQDKGLQDGVRVMIGGVPTTQEFADSIGADAWGRDALDAVEKARKLVSAR